MQRSFYFLSGAGLGILIDIPLLILFSFGGPSFSGRTAEWLGTGFTILMFILPIALGWGMMKVLGKEQGLKDPATLSREVNYIPLLKIAGLLLLPVIGFVLAWFVVNRGAY